MQADGDGIHRDVLEQFTRQCLVLIGAIVGFADEPFFAFLFHHGFAPLVGGSASGSQLYGFQFDFQGLRLFWIGIDVVSGIRAWVYRIATVV